MYRLRSIYGRKAYEAWTASVERERALTDLRPHQEDAGGEESWRISSYVELVKAVSFLSVMNKRLFMYCRGQRKDHRLLPSLLRERWRPPEGDQVELVGTRQHYWKSLPRVGEVAYRACAQFGLPRWRTMKRVPEAQWAIAQHYGLWPTPFLDLTRSLRVAATFALGWEPADSQSIAGYVYVLGMPAPVDSISISFDDQLMLVRLEAVCPPVAERPHLQEGALLVRYPFGERELDESSFSRCDAARRLIARFQIVDDGSFWSDDFPRLSESSLLPEADKLRQWFCENVHYGSGQGIVHLVQ